MRGGERLHHFGADLPACVGVRPGDKPEHAVHLVHGAAQRLHLHGGRPGVGGSLGVVGHKREGLHQIKPGGFAQFFAAHFGQGADVFIPQPADAEHGVGRFAHAHEPRGAVGAGRKMHRRHFGNAVAVVFVGCAQGHVAARNVGNGDMPRGGCRGHGENFKAVAQQQHRVGAVGSKITVKNVDSACNRAGNRLVGVVGKNWQACGDGKTVVFDFVYGFAQPRAEVRARHDKLQVEFVGRRDLLHDRPQQPIFRPRGGNDADGAHITPQFFHPPQNRAWRFGPALHASAWGKCHLPGAWWSGCPR